MDEHTQKIEGLKRSQVTPCVMCGQGLMHDHNLSFYRARLDFLFADVGAIELCHGFELMMCSPLLAQVMNPDENLAVAVSREEALVCLPCALRYPLAVILDACQHNEEVSCARS